MRRCMPFFPTSSLTLPLYSSFLSKHIINFTDGCVIFARFHIDHVGELMRRCIHFSPTSLLTALFYYICHGSFMRILSFDETPSAHSFSFLVPSAQSLLSLTLLAQSLLFLTPLSQSLLFLTPLALSLSLLTHSAQPPFLLTPSAQSLSFLD